MGPRIYTYKITFPSQGWWYWGVHKEKTFGEEYYGSPKSHAKKWKWFEFEKQILEFFDSYEEARKVEIRLIKPDLNNPMCLNEGCGGHISDVYQSRGVLNWWKNNPGQKEKTRRLGLKHGRDNMTAFNDKMTSEERKQHARHASLKADQNKRKEIMRRIQAEFNPAKNSQWATNGLNNRRIRDGVLPKGYRWGFTSNARLNLSVNSTKFRCLVTGFESTAGPLSCYQKKRGINTSLRERVE
jgi:hypothetical protein